MKTINGQNYFNKASFNEACEALERGETVKIYIDCIGHTRNNNEQEAYREALMKKYGWLLEDEMHESAFTYSYSYRLSKEKV